MSGLIWIQTVWHSDGIHERIFQKNDFEERQQMIKSYPVGKELTLKIQFLQDQPLAGL